MILQTMKKLLVENSMKPYGYDIKTNMIKKKSNLRPRNGRYFKEASILNRLGRKRERQKVLIIIKQDMENNGWEQM